MKTLPGTGSTSWRLAIFVFLVYCVVAVLLSALMVQGEHTIEWLGILFVLIIACVLSGLYARVEHHAPVRHSPLFVLWLFASAMIFCVIGVAMHVGGPAAPGEVHGTDTAIAFIFLQDVSESVLPPFTIVMTHSIMIFGIVAAVEFRRVARSSKSAMDFS